MNTKKKPDAYRVFIKLRCTNEQKQTMMKIASNRNQTFSEYARERLLK